MDRVFFKNYDKNLKFIVFFSNHFKTYFQEQLEPNKSG